MAALFVHDTSLTPEPPRWHRHLRHLEGWQGGVLAVGMALLAALLVIPRPVRPAEIPLPTVDRAEERRAKAVERGRLERARTEPLPFLVRAVGEAVRSFGRAEATGDREGVRLVREIRDRVTEARRSHGDEPLLALRAAQSDLFLRAVGAVRAGGAHEELRELGGAFTLRLSDAPGILDRLHPSELDCLFSVRWARLAGLIEARPFAPSLNQWRLYYRTLLRHPDLLGEKQLDRRREAMLATVGALARIDPDYPHDLGRGVLQYQLGNPAAAVKHFRIHLARHPGGEYRLRAQNYLVKALSEVAPGPVDEEAE